jgi:matrixin
MRLGALGLLAAPATALCPGQAHAFCREVNASPPVAYDPADAGCFGTSTGLPTLFWRNQCVSFSLQEGASKWVSLNDATNVATQAFSTWTTAPCAGGGSPSITPSLFPAVQCDSVPSQGHNNPIIFRDDAWPYGDSANAIGFTTLTVDLDTGEILGAAIEINSANFHIVASGPVPQGGYDLASILTHEAGHFLGLAHSGDSTAIMYAYYKAGSVTLTPDDIAGICTIYDPSGSRTTINGPVSATTCNSQPIYGFLQQCGSLDSGALNSVASGPASSPADGGATPCTTDSSSCAVGLRAGSTPAAAAWALGLVGVGTMLRRRRQRGEPR